MDELRKAGTRRPDAGVKLATMLRIVACDGGNKARLTKESTKETVKTIAQGMPVTWLYLW